MQCCCSAKTCQRCCAQQRACRSALTVSHEQPGFSDDENALITSPAVGGLIDAEVENLPQRSESAMPRDQRDSAEAPIINDRTEQLPALDGELDFQ